MKRETILHQKRGYVPKKETLNQLCFVTGADSNYFKWMIQTLESLKNTNNYCKFPICILDLGLTQFEKEYLYKNFQIAYMVCPGWDVPVSEHFSKKPGYQAMTARSFLGLHFPQFRYHFWIDADAWVQDGNAIDYYIQLCEFQGIGIARHPIRNFFNATKWYNNGFLSKEDDELLKRKRMINSGVLCLDSKSEVAKLWRFYSFDLGQKYKTIYDEVPLMLALYKKGDVYNLLNGLYFHAVPDQLKTDENYNLYAGDNFAGFIHLMGKYKKSDQCFLKLVSEEREILSYRTFNIGNQIMEIQAAL